MPMRPRIDARPKAVPVPRPRGHADGGRIDVQPTKADDRARGGMPALDPAALPAGTRGASGRRLQGSGVDLGRPWRPRPSRLHGPAAGAGRSRSQPCCPDQHRPAPDPTGLGHRAEGAAGSRQQERHRPGRHRPVVQLLRGQPPRRDRRPARGLGPHRCPSAGSAMVLLDGAVAPPTAPQPPPLLLPFLNVEVKPRQQAWAPRQAGAIGSRRSSHPGRPRHSRSTDVGHDLALG